MISRTTIQVLFFFCMACGMACGGEPALEVIELHIADHRLHIEIADTPETRRRGLAFRKQLAEEAGMLFVFEQERPLSFWMKDTLIPLSIAFISSTGEILEIRHMAVPGDLTPVRSRQAARYALELNHGSFARLGIHAGDHIALPSLGE